MICLCRWMALGLAIVLVSGCESSPTPLAAPAGLAPTGTSAPADAAAAVTAAAAAMRDGKLELAFDLLPASYQKDVDGLIVQFASTMDPDVWDATFGVLGKATLLMKAKKELLLSMAKQPGNEARSEALAGRWDGLVGGLDQFVKSDLSELNKLQSSSTRDLLQKGIGPLVKELLALGTAVAPGGTNPLADFDKVKAEVVTSTETTASVKITSPKKAEPETVEFTRVDGKWIPKSMADDWTTNVEKARDNLKSAGGDALTANKPQILQVLKSVNGVLDEMMKAESAEQVQAAAFPLILQAMMMQGQMGAGQPKPKKAAAQVTITVAQELSEDDQAKLEAALMALADDTADGSTTTTRIDGKTIITVSPVADVAEFAKKLTIAKDAEVDEDNRAISVGKIVFE